MRRLLVPLAFLCLLVALLCFLMVGCTIGGESPDVPTADAPGPMLPADPILPVHATPILTPMWAMIPPTTQREPVLQPEPRTPAAKSGKRIAEPSPTQVIEEAQRQARLDVTPRGYFGGSAVHRYIWQPGKIYTVYLSPASGTRITLPPNEILAAELVLPPDSFDVSSATIGTEVSKSTVIFLRPCSREEPGCKPVKNLDVALVSESGRSYDLHLIIGNVSMLAVAWQIAPIPMIQLEESPPVPGGGAFR